MFPLERQGSRVGLREFELDDADAVHAWTGDPDAIQYVPLGPFDDAANLSYVRSLLAESAAAPRSTYTMAIYAIDDSARSAVGAVALSIDSREHRRAELGFMLRRSAWGRGFASEAVQLMLRFGFADLAVHRIWAVCDPRNVASRQLLARCGMQFEGCLRGDMAIRGERCDSLLHAVTADDVDASPYL